MNKSKSLYPIANMPSIQSLNDVKNGSGEKCIRSGRFVSLQVFQSLLVPARTCDAGAGQISFGNRRGEWHDEKI
jgi:hypothetical protein